MMATDGQPLAGRRILVVEDDFLIAETLAEVLAAAGALVTGPVGTADEAQAVLAKPDPAVDAAVLDIDLHGQKSYALADAMIRRGIPFVLTTGYDASAVDAAYRHYPRCEKPVTRRAILAALAAL